MQSCHEVGHLGSVEAMYDLFYWCEFSNEIIGVAGDIFSHAVVNPNRAVDGAERGFPCSIFSVVFGLCG